MKKISTVTALTVINEQDQMMPDYFDFEYWTKLAQSDPEAFERKRGELIGDFIAGQSEENRRRLKQLQWRVDSVREASANPLDSCVRIYEMLLEKAFGKNGFTETLNALNNGSGIPERHFPPSPNGKVLFLRNFQDRRGSRS